MKHRVRLLFWFVIALGLVLGLAVQQSRNHQTGLRMPLDSNVMTISGSVSPLILNEFLADNKRWLADEDGDYSDWIELYNRSDQPISLATWSLTDDPSRPTKWTFPDISLPAHTYLVIFASGKNRLREPDFLHTNFKLNRQGEFLGLYQATADRFMSYLDYPEQFYDQAYGQVSNEAPFGEWGYLPRPTPGWLNDTHNRWLSRVEPVQFSHSRGFYEQPFTVTLHSPTPGAVVRYTTDGRAPTDEHGQLYTEPLVVTTTTILRAGAFKPGPFKPAELQAESYIFLADVIQQGPEPANFPATWGVYGEPHKRFPQYPPGEPVQADYAMDPTIVAQYADQLKPALQALPSLSLALSPQDFTTLYSNPQQRGVSWERPASIEFWHHQGEFQINAGIRMQGGQGRREFMFKHSFRLFFKDKYGAGKLNYPLFADSPVTLFDTLVLRAGTNRSFVNNLSRDPRLTTYTRDEWLRDSQVKLSGVGSHGLFVHLYINGLYWGIYNLVERPDHAFMAAYYGGDKVDWYVRSHSGTVNGTDDRLDMMRQALTELGGLPNMAPADAFQFLQDYVDIPHFIDYVILNWYAGNEDWPINNWYAGVHNPAGQIRIFVWDAEHTWIDGAQIRLQRSWPGQNIVRTLFEYLIASADFRLALADRLYRHLHHNGLLTDAQAIARWDEFNDQLAPAIVAESARWGDVRFDQPITPADWAQSRHHVEQQMVGNGEKLIELARQEGYYPPIDPPVFNQRGGLVDRGFMVRLSGQPGHIYYTTDGSDPRQIGSGEIAPQARLYEQPFAVTATRHIKTRLWVEGVWSALNEATFRLGPSEVGLTITEIMYHPPDGEEYEFIELANLSDRPLPLANVTTEGITFTFFANTPPLPPGETVVLVRNRPAFASRYPTVPLGGKYEGRLANGGETITLRDAQGNIMTSVSYEDANGWPLSADGRGDSLVRINPAGDPNNPTNWRASLAKYGSPGRLE